MNHFYSEHGMLPIHIGETIVVFAVTGIADRWYGIVR